MSERQRYLAVLAALALSTGMMGAKCGSDSSTSTGTPSSSSSSSSSSSGGVVSTAMFVQAVPPAGVTTFIHQSTSFSSACSIPVADIVPNPSTPPSGNANNDLLCILDAAEGDLYYQGMTVDFNAPPGVCNYVSTGYYWFWNYKPGVPGNSLSYCLSTASGTEGEVVSGSVTVTNGTLDTKGNYTCNTDYTAAKGPNCCEGTYTLNISTSSDGTLGSCGNTQTSTVKYPGFWGNCAAGAGVDLATRKTPDGFPEGLIFPTPNTGLNSEIVITPPNTKNLGTNLYIANYYDPTLNGGNPPEGLLPVTLEGVPVSPQLYYQVSCLDAGADILARIRLQIRSWDTVADFTAESNPYTAGDESGFGGTHLWHDLLVWIDSGYFLTYPQNAF